MSIFQIWWIIINHSSKKLNEPKARITQTYTWWFVVLVPTTAAWSDLLAECAAGMQCDPQPHQLGRDGAQRPDQVHGLEE